MALPEGERIAVVEQSIKAVHEDLHSMWEAINGTRNDVSSIRTEDIAGLRSDMERRFSDAQAERTQLRVLMLGRPSWAVSALITILSSALVGLLVYVASTGGA